MSLSSLMEHNANGLRAWQTQFGSTTAVEENAIHARASMDAVEVQQKIG
jgi:hypothetical protein